MKPEQSKEVKTYWQPEFDENGHIKGHYGAGVFSFQVWRKKENLLKEYPDCVPVEYTEGDIEEPTFMDEEQPKEVLDAIALEISDLHVKQGRSAAIEKAHTYKEVTDEYCAQCETESPSLLHECLICGSPTKEVLHTQGEWEVRKIEVPYNLSIYSSKGWHIATLNPYSPENINSEANAELIVKACNNYERLKQTLADLVHSIFNDNEALFSDAEEAESYLKSLQ